MADTVRIEGEMTDEEGYWWGLTFTDGPLSIELTMGHDYLERWLDCLDGLARRHRSSVGWKGFQASITYGGDFVLRSEGGEEVGPDRSVFVWHAPAADVLPQLSAALRRVDESFSSHEPLEYPGPRAATASDTAIAITGSLAADDRRWQLTLEQASFRAKLTMGVGRYRSWFAFAHDKTWAPPGSAYTIDFHGLRAALDDKNELELRSNVDSFDAAGHCQMRWHAPMVKIRPALVSAMASVRAALREWEDERLSQGLAQMFPAE